MKKLAYTVLLGGTDNLKEPHKPNKSWEYVCITDDPSLKSDVWSVQVVKSENPKKYSRYYKINNIFPEYDLTVYADATFKIKGDLDRLALSKTSGIWLNNHPQRNCAYKEAEVVKQKKLDDPEFLDSRIAKYKKEGFPENYGLWRCGIMIRNPKHCSELLSTWWEEVESGSWRDQVSFPYACWKTKEKPNTILHGITNLYFQQSLHATFETPSWKSIGLIDESLKEKYPLAHAIRTRTGLMYPSWVGNYISLKNGTDRFLELVKILNGTVING